MGSLVQSAVRCGVRGWGGEQELVDIIELELPSLPSTL